ncbi:unnamed protein product, partial [Closterium sp. NIES-54]
MDSGGVGSGGAAVGGTQYGGAHSRGAGVGGAGTGGASSGGARAGGAGTGGASLTSWRSRLWGTQSALGVWWLPILCLEDRQFELEFLATASPSLCAMLLSPEGDLDALDIPTPCTYREAVPGPWPSQWKVAMDSELASWKFSSTYVDAVPPPRANVVDGMWLFKVKRPPRSPPVFK